MQHCTYLIGGVLQHFISAIIFKNLFLIYNVLLSGRSKGGSTALMTVEWQRAGAEEVCVSFQCVHGSVTGTRPRHNTSQSKCM